jgi:hypothetical protein
VKRDTKKHTGARRRAARRSSALLKWTVAAGAVALVVYGVSRMSNIAYSDKDLTMIDFSDLGPKAKRAALEEANAARCPCGCGMTLAQCVATDSTCPLRTGHIDLIRGMVARARVNANAGNDQRRGGELPSPNRG